MATVIEKRPDGSVVIVVPATDAAELKVGCPRRCPAGWRRW